MTINTFIRLSARSALLLASYLLTPFCMAQNTQAVTEKEKLTTYFLDYLSGKEQAYPATPVSIPLSSIRERQEQVWGAWVEANRRFEEEKLIPLEKLDQNKSGSWQLPDSLEPHAIMPYYWGYKGESAPEGYPLYLYLHGSGNKNNEWQTGILLANKFDDAPATYFIPQIPNIGEYYRWWQKAKQYAWEKLFRQTFVSGHVNPNQIYIFGISEGGYGSQRLASFYADYLAGAGPMAGGEPLKNAPAENCSNIAFSFLTGAKDMGFYRNKLTEYTKKEFERLQKSYPGEFVHRIELIPERGHHIDYAQTTPWLKQFSRNPYPKHVCWENFEMDGIYRKGFYNIAVQERSNDNYNSRTYYELDIRENNIALKAQIVTYKAVEIDPVWGLELKFEKSYQPATKGKIIIYLCKELIDLNKKITLTINGKKVFNGKVKPSLEHIVNSCATFFDPMRLYPAAIEVDLSTL